MAEWKCGCGKNNPLRMMNCASCGREIPESEIRRIAKIELKIQINEVKEKRRKSRQRWYQAADCLTKWPLRAGMTILTVIFFGWCMYLGNPDEISSMDGNHGTTQRIIEQAECRYTSFREEKVCATVGKASCFMKEKKTDEIPSMLEKGRRALDERGDGLENKGDKILHKCEENIKDKAVYIMERITGQKEKGSEE